LATFGFIVISASGIGHALLHPVEDDSGQSAQVVTSLIDGGATLDIVPEGFEDELGYRPVVAAGALVNPKGACSTPGGVGPDSFTDACRVHDFGYDILRYAEGTGTRVGPWARFDLDRRLYADLLSACDTVTCEATATVYYTAVTLNSIRQGYVAPTEEPTVPWAITAVGVVGLATAPTRRHKWKQPPIDAFWVPRIEISVRLSAGHVHPLPRIVIAGELPPFGTWSHGSLPLVHGRGRLAGPCRLGGGLAPFRLMPWRDARRPSP
jgi:hypothetical protein